MPKELSPQEVRWVCEPTMFGCDSTRELAPVAGILGQDRALSALELGLNITTPGFNVYVAGAPGTGRTTTIRSFLETLAAKKKPPADWCYVHNFADPYSPNALELPSGLGAKFKADMKLTIENASRSIAQAFSSKEYAERREEITKLLNQKREESFKLLSERAQKAGFLVQTSPVGLVFVLAPDGRPISEEQYRELTEQVKQEVRRRQEELNRLFREELAKLRTEETATQKKLEDTNRQVADYAISFLFDELNKKYGEYPEITDYLKAVRKDITENLELFQAQPRPSEEEPLAVMQTLARTQAIRRYEVNVLVDNAQLKGAPVVIEFNPTFNNLLGRMEREAQFGTLYTDFTLIRAGSLHRANGGYLVLRALDLLANFQSWEGLKRAIRERKLVVEDISERLGFMATKTLNPEPIPFDAKVIIIGEPLIYHLLYLHEPEFKELFKVKADFDTRMERSEENLKSYVGVICRFAHEEKLREIKSQALAKIAEYSVRLAGDRDKLSAHFAEVADIIREASFWAGMEGAEFIEAKHVMQAIDKKIYRSNLIQEHINEAIAKGTLFIDTDGEKAGQVNGLSVIELGDFAFGRPSRITASIGVGREGLIDIERESKLGGPLHTKGVMILSGYLVERYASNLPLSLSARLVFEQSYEGVEGDSASSGELYTLLSRLADVPLRQYIAVTGSVNQKGEVQAIGGVNEKIEGFFEVCRLRGLNGKQGVCIPEANVKHLMLKEDVVQAIAEGKFHIYPVKTIDEGIEVLTDSPAGKQLADGSFEPDSFNDRVKKRLLHQATTLRDFSRQGEPARPRSRSSREPEDETIKPAGGGSS
ncbi:MAG: ATP-binding protein [Chloroflexota bacterium]